MGKNNNQQIFQQDLVTSPNSSKCKNLTAVGSQIYFTLRIIWMSPNLAEIFALSDFSNLWPPVPFLAILCWPLQTTS